GSRSAASWSRRWARASRSRRPRISGLGSTSSSSFPRPARGCSLSTAQAAGRAVNGTSIGRPFTGYRLPVTIVDDAIPGWPVGRTRDGLGRPNRPDGSGRRGGDPADQRSFSIGRQKLRKGASLVGAPGDLGRLDESWRASGGQANPAEYDGRTGATVPE